MNRILFFLSVVLVVMLLALSPPAATNNLATTDNINHFIMTSAQARHGPNPITNGLSPDNAMPEWMNSSSQLYLYNQDVQGTIGNIAQANYDIRSGFVKSNLTWPS